MDQCVSETNAKSNIYRDAIDPKINKLASALTRYVKALNAYLAEQGKGILPDNLSSFAPSSETTSRTK